MGEPRSGYCDACFSGDYLIQLAPRTAPAPLRVVGA
jgi:amidophosphoribosyltransferase